MEKLDSTHVVLNLLDLCGTENDGADIGVHCAPCESELCRVSAKTFSDLGELADFLNLGLALLGLELLDGGVEEFLVVGEAGTLGDAVVVFGSEQSGGERTPDSCAILELVVEGLVFDLEAFAVEHILEK